MTQAKTILIVEDEAVTAMDLKERLQRLGYDVSGIAVTGIQAVQQVEKDPPDLVLMDIMLQGDMDGIEAAGRIRVNSRVPVIFVTAHTDMAILERARLSEPFGYVVKPFKERELQSNIEMALYKHRMEEQLRDSHDRFDQALRGTIAAIDRMVQLKDPFLDGHQQRTSELAGAIAREMGMDEDQAEGIELAARVHDIGMIGIPFDILRKGKAFDENEEKICREHPRIGYEILRDIDFPWPIAEVILHHHEQVDGAGYPDGLRGEGISLAARIVSVAQEVEFALNPPRYDYNPHETPAVDDVLNEIDAGRGSKYDPDVIDACIRVFREKGFSFNEQ